MELRFLGKTTYFSRADLLLVFVFVLLALLLYLYFKKPENQESTLTAR